MAFPLPATKRRVNLIADAGCDGDNVGDPDNWSLIQQSVDHYIAQTVAAGGLAQTGSVYVPATSRGFKVSKPVVIDAVGVSFEGDDPNGSQIWAEGPFCPIWTGVKRYPPSQPNGASALHFPDVTALLDGSTPTIHGFRPVAGVLGSGHNDPALTNVCGWIGSPFDLGPRIPASVAPGFYQDGQDFTLEFAIHISSITNWNLSYPHLLGMGVNTDQPAPYMIELIEDSPSSHRLHVRFHTKTSWPTQNPYFAEVPVTLHPGAGQAGTHRFAIHWKWSTGKVYIYFDKVLIYSAALCPPGSRFGDYQGAGFMLGTAGFGVGTYPVDAPRQGVTYCGCRTSVGCVYVDGTIGRAQARTDANPDLSDNYMYFTMDANCIAIDYGLDAPDLATKPLDGNRFRSTLGGGQSFAFQRTWGHVYASDSGGGHGKQEFHNLRLRSGNTYGGALGLAWLLGCNIRSVRLEGGAFGAQPVMPTGASYPISLHQVHTEGVGAAWYGVAQIITMDQCDIGSVGRWGWLLAGCNAEIDFTVTGDHGIMDSLVYYIQTGYAAALRLKRILIDFESAGLYPSRCMIYVQQDSFFGMDLKLEGIGGGYVAAIAGVPQVPWLILDGLGSTTWPPGKCEIDGLNLAENAATSVVYVNTPNWHVHIKRSWLPKSCPSVAFAPGVTSHHCIVEHTGYSYSSMPTDGHWVAGVDRLMLGKPLAGQPTEMVCTAGGIGASAQWGSRGHLLLQAQTPAIAGLTPGTWRVGATVPSNSLGQDGDLYLRTATGDVYQRIAGAYVIVANIRGPAGTGGGAGWLFGVGAPSDSLGSDSNIYMDNVSGNVYLKIAGHWALQGNLKGPRGDIGRQGPAANVPPSPVPNTVSGPFADRDVFTALVAIFKGTKAFQVVQYLADFQIADLPASSSPFLNLAPLSEANYDEESPKRKRHEVTYQLTVGIRSTDQTMRTRQLDYLKSIVYNNIENSSYGYCNPDYSIINDARFLPAMPPEQWWQANARFSWTFDSQVGMRVDKVL